MEEIILVIHLLLAVFMIGLILLQRSEGGGLGMGGSSGGSGMSMGGLMTARGTGNFLTKTTAILAACFFATSLTLAVLAKNATTDQSIVDGIAVETIETEVAPEPPTEPEEPSAPLRDE